MFVPFYRRYTADKARKRVKKVLTTELTNVQLIDGIISLIKDMANRGVTSVDRYLGYASTFEEFVDLDIISKFFEKLGYKDISITKADDIANTLKVKLSWEE